MKGMFTKLTLAGVLTAGCLSVGHEAQARGPWPTMEWVKQLGSTGDDRAEAIDVDAQGNVYSITKYTANLALDFGNGVRNITKVGTQDYLIVKQSPNGEILWSYPIQAAAASIIANKIRVDKDGNVYVTGSYAGTVDFDNGPGVASYTSALNSRSRNSPDFFLLKLNTNGDFGWVRVAGGESGDLGTSIDFDANHEHVIVSGNFSYTVDFAFGGATNVLVNNSGSSFIAKFKVNGEKVWVKPLMATTTSGSSVTAWGVAVDNSGNVHAVGTFFKDFDADPGTGTAILTSVDHGDVFAVKLNSNGDYVWAKSMGGVMYDIAYDVAVDKVSNVYITGSFQSNANFETNGGTHFLYTKGGSDVFLTKLDDKGGMVYAYNMGSSTDDAGKSIKLDEFNNILIAGDFQSPRSDFDPYPNPEDTFNLVSYGGYDGFVLKLNNDAKFIWATNVGTKFGPDNCSGVAVRNGYVYVSGIFYQTADFDPAGGGITQLTVVGNSDAFVMKLNDCHKFPNPEDNPLAIAGDAVVCENGTYTYVAPSLEFVNAYEWILPTDWTGSSDTSSIEVVAAGDGTIQLKIYGFCDTVTLNMDIKNDAPEVVIVVNEDVLSVNTPENYASFQWYKDGDKIDGATNSSYEVDANGVYSVVATGEFGCSDSASYTVTNHTGINNVIASQISIYPNPAKNVVNVSSPIALTVNVMGIDGKILSSTNVAAGPNAVSVQNLVAGMYMLMMVDQNGELVKVEKVSIEK